MKIAHLIWSLNVGGAELMLIDIINEQVLKNDVSLYIINDTFSQELLKDINKKVNIKFIKRSPASKNPWCIIKLLFIIRMENPDIIHAHQHSLIKFIKFLSVPKVLTLHTTNINLVSDVSRFNKIFSISEAVKNDLLNRYPEYMSSVIYNGIKFSGGAGCGKKEKGVFRIIQIGRLDSDIKGQDILISALSEIKNKEENVSVDFIGEGESEEYLTKLVCSLGLESSVNFLGKQSRQYIYESLGGYNLLVQPSKIEGFGLSIVEAMASRVPVLVSDIEGPMEIIKNGAYGNYFKKNDATHCASEILRIIKRSDDPEFQSKLNVIFEYAQENFNISKTEKSYVNEYEKLI